MRKRRCFFILLKNVLCLVQLLWAGLLFSQTQLNGIILDSANKEPLPYVNIGIKQKGIGTASRADGTFTINITDEYRNDALTFSCVGYNDVNLDLMGVRKDYYDTILLSSKITQLAEVVINAEHLVEKKYGIKKRGALIHFTDGMFQTDDVFEIGQLIKLGSKSAKITSLNLHINATRKDSGTFRINFYKYNDGDNKPAERAIERSIIQRHPIRNGWLTFELDSRNIYLQGNFVVAIEVIPEPGDAVPQLYYEVKLGGSSKSFYRRSSLGSWNTPPHHYCMYVNALVDKSTPDEPDDTETDPSFTVFSDSIGERYSVYVKLPKHYGRNSDEKYPVIYHVDGNAYFDQIATTVEGLYRKKRISIEPIVVGIGYGNAYLMDSLRYRDYTYPAVKSEEGEVSGGGKEFYDFITQEIIPKIDSTYRTDTSNRTLMGHSLGGYFTLYALLRTTSKSSGFRNFVAASPSIWYGDHYLANQFESLSTSENRLRNANIYISFGELELDDFSRLNFINLSESIKTRDVNRMATKIYKKMEHMGTAAPSFEDGIEFVLAK